MELTEPLHPSEHDIPYEGNEDVWVSKPRPPSPTPASIRRHADMLLKEGRLNTAKEPIYPVVPGPRGED